MPYNYRNIHFYYENDTLWLQHTFFMKFFRGFKTSCAEAGIQRGQESFKQTLDFI
jgi:hypothetical protein